MDDPAQDKMVKRGLQRMVDAGVSASRLMVFVLIGAPWLNFGETVDRITGLRRDGYRPFAMPYKALDGTFDGSRNRSVQQLARWANQQRLVKMPWEDFALRNRVEAL